MSFYALLIKYLPPAAVGFPRIGKKWFLLALSLPFVAGWVILLFLDDYEEDDDDD